MLRQSSVVIGPGLLMMKVCGRIHLWLEPWGGCCRAFLRQV